MPFCNISGYKIGLCHKHTIFIKEQMLCSKVNLHIGITIIIFAMTVCSLRINRFTFHFFSGFQII